jgi:predicted alpha-1,2-mannosidase
MPPASEPYGEGTAWIYLWHVPHDVDGLIEMLGGEERALMRLRDFFMAENPYGREFTIDDLTGTIGQYAHGNEPTHHIIYLFPYFGVQWEAARYLNFVFEKFYTDTPDGYIGNEDCGQMSAWFVFSAIGFYPVFPASGQYVLGRPLFNRATLRFENGRKFEVKAIGNSRENMYIQTVRWNGRPWEKSYVTHEMLMQGGRLEVVMGPEPNKSFGFDKSARPPSVLRDN